MRELRVSGSYFIHREMVNGTSIFNFHLQRYTQRHPVTGLYSFLGLRYAEPPVGENRFLRPKYRHLQGDINATLYGPPCPQPDPNRRGYIIGNEDCLLLNVFTPQMPDESTGLPVLVFIHGGGFRYFEIKFICV